MTTASAPRTFRLLPPLELEVMKELWPLGEATVSQVRSAMYQERPLAYTTVMTLLDRLARKGIVSRRKKGRSYLYRPDVSREEALEQVIAKLVYDFFGNSRDELLEYLQGSHSSGPRHESPSAAILDSALL